MTEELDLQRLADRAEELAAAGMGMDLVLQAADPEAAQEQLAEKRKEIEKQKRAVEAEVVRRKREIEAQQETLRAELARQMAEANRALAPLKKLMAQATEAIWTVELYLGSKESILTLRDGAPADRETPITMRQLVLAMDEECAVAAEEGGIDSLNIEEFDEWLLADPAHLEQVLPEKKGVVALVPRWTTKNYDDPWKELQADEGNKQTYFLIRNGEQLYRIWTDFRVGKKLLPVREEYEAIFTREERDWDTGETRRVALKPGTREWEEADAAAGARERHFMRVALVFQGLIDRTTVWHPVPPETSLLSPKSHEEGKVRFIYDGQDDRALGTGREPFYEWLARLNAGLRPGMRVTIDPHGAHGEGHYLRNGGGGFYNPRLHPTNAEDPPADTLLPVKGDASRMYVSYPRTTEMYFEGGYDSRTGTYERGGYRLPKNAASCEIRPGDKWVFPFDLAEPEEIRIYLRARLDRHAYVDMFPVLKSALSAKAAEAREEEPFRVMLAGVLARENGGTVADAQERIPGLVSWYKLANRYHRALKDDDAKAVRQIVAEDAARAKALGDPVFIEKLAEMHPDFLVIGKPRSDSRYTVVTPEDDFGVYARRRIYGKRGKLMEERRWWVPEPSVVNRWDVFRSTDAWESYRTGKGRAKDEMTGPEREAAVRLIRDFAEGHDCNQCSGDWKRWNDEKCEECGGSGRESWELISITYEPSTAAGKQSSLMAWMKHRKEAWAHHDERIEMRGSKAAWSRSEDWKHRDIGEDGLWLSFSSRDYTGSFRTRSGEDGFPAARRGALWIDESALRALIKEEEALRAKQARSAERTDAIDPYRREIEAQRKERAKAAHVRAFIAKYDHPELYEGHMKAHPKEALIFESLAGLRGALLAALDAGTLEDAVTLGEIWPDAPEEDRGLYLERPDPEPDPEFDPDLDDPDDDPDWVDVDAEEESPLMLPAGDE